ncbi:MAG TPA: flagellar protein export ATPase FliI [candidate division Zixibacteria bacterium]
MQVDYQKYSDILERTDPVKRDGKVCQVIGLVIESTGPAVSVGEMCYIESQDKNLKIKSEVVGFRDKKVMLMPLGNMDGVSPGSTVIASGEPFFVSVGHELLGRVIDGLGEPIDSKEQIITKHRKPIYNSPPSPLARRRIKEPLYTGIKAIDSLVTFGKGQRAGIFSGSGVGKSIVLGMIARESAADVNVIGLVGERGREVREFIEKDLGEDGLKRSVVVAVTSDKPALIRLRGALIATTIAEYFRDLGMDVMLMMDSLTRVAMAQREIGLAIGEPPTTKGYTPSVFALLPKLLERAGASDVGSITGLYTVLVEGDDLSEPVSDAARAILDGHIVLSRKLAALNHYPAVDVLGSVSRVMIDVISDEHRKLADKAKEVLANYRESEDLINIGAYVKGSNPKVDYAISKIEALNNFLKQGIGDKADFKNNIETLKEIFKDEGIQVSAAEGDGVPPAPRKREAARLSSSKK